MHLVIFGYVDGSLQDDSSIVGLALLGNCGLTQNLRRFN